MVSTSLIPTPNILNNKYLTTFNKIMFNLKKCIKVLKKTCTIFQRQFSPYFLNTLRNGYIQNCVVLDEYIMEINTDAVTNN